MRKWTLWKESQVKKLCEAKNSSSSTNINQSGESSFLFFFSKKSMLFQKIMKKLFAESSRTRIILCATMGHDDASAIFIFAFCESWKSRRSSLFSRDANKESLLWKLNGAQKLIEPEDTILSKSTKDILKIFLVLRLSVNYADRALKFFEIVSFCKIDERSELWDNISVSLCSKKSDMFCIFK